MALDPDLVRIDLLRVKRKLFLQYQEGSKERQDFVVASKLSELGYLSKLADPATVELVFEEYSRQQRSEIVTILIGIGFGVCLSVMLLGFHQSHLTNLWLSFYYLPGVWGVAWSAIHVFHMIDQWRKFQPFQKEYAVLRRKIDKLENELKGLVQ
jgi:hypothetical protein